MPRDTAGSPGNGKTSVATEYIDTNVLIYAHDRDAGTKYLAAKELIRRLTIDSNGALSYQVLAEFGSVVTKKWRRPVEFAEQAIADLAIWTIHVPAYSDLFASASLCRRFQIGWYDAMIVNSATQLGCATLWSEDFPHDQQYGMVTVRSPFQA